MQTSLELFFADGEYTFALKLPQLSELQRLRGCGIFTLYGRVMAGRASFEGTELALPQRGQAYVEDLLETIRLALVGGGTEAVRAKELVATYCYPAAPLREAWALSAAVLSALIEGYEPPKAEPAEEPEPAADQQTVSI